MPSRSEYVASRFTMSPCWPTNPDWKTNASRNPALLALAVTARRSNPNANRSGAVSGSLISTISPRTRGCRKRRRFQERVNPFGDLFLSFLTGQRAGPHDHMQPDLGSFGHALDGSCLLFEKAGGACVTRKLEEQGRQHDQLARERALLRGLYACGKILVRGNRDGSLG